MTDSVRQLGRYELLRRIAKGGMGEIYLARTRGAAGFEKSCIIKTILPHLAEEEEFVEKFLDEGRIVVQLVHGNIVPVFDMGQEGEEYFIAMEYIAGRDLREIIKALDAHGKTMPVDLALFITSEVCKGLDYAHRKTDEGGTPLGIVHRDVSPSNVLVSREGEIKLIDFGIARAAGRLSKTVSGRIQGKFCYMSPEQAGGRKLDGRSDIFSAGIVLYELLTGFRPFEGDTDLESLDLVRRCEFDPPSTLNAAIPEEVDRIVQKALAKDPDERYPAIDKLQIAILQYLYSTGTSPTPSELGRFLAGLFPDGLEREELRNARDASPKPERKMSLDEALDFELGLLGEDGASVDPHETTAVSSGDVLLPEGRSASQVSGLLAETGPTANDRPLPVGAPPKQSRMRLWIPAAFALALVAAGVVYATSKPSVGTVRINTDPAGAQVVVDDVTVLGATTPYTARLEVGRHTVRLEKDGFEPRELTVDVSAGTQTIDGTAGRLKPLQTLDPREIRVTASPADAILYADGTRFGTGAGAALMVQPERSVRVTAERDGCETLGYLLSHSYDQDTLHLELANCGAEKADAGADEQAELAAVVQPVRNIPRVMPDRVRAPGIESRRPDPKETAAELTEEMGCLNLRLDYPAKATIAVDGKSLGEREWRLANHPLRPGAHSVRVKNEAVGVDETFEVQIEPGKKCASHFFRSSK